MAPTLTGHANESGVESDDTSQESQSSSSSPASIKDGYKPEQSETGMDFSFGDHINMCDYAVGFTTTAKRHDPPEPFNAENATKKPCRSAKTTTLLQEISTSDPPLPGYSASDQTITLVVTSTIRTGARSGPQLVIFNNSMVAKIYDPLCYNPTDDSDVVGRATEAYSCEAAAYRHLQQHPEISDIVPTFYGTWSFDLSVCISHNGLITLQSRQVHFILIEYIQGPSMDKINPHEISEHARLVILKQCIDAEIRILHTGLEHRDYVPRNIILLGSDYETPRVQVKVIDFNFCELLVHPGYPDQRFAQKTISSFNRWAPKLVNPVMRYFGNLDDFADLGWCSEDRYTTKKWMWKTFGNDCRYRSVRWDPDKPRSLPRYVDKD
ncbi:hypothetical protein OPT61_g6043 [Boeremia exigua]|uniref:Uncharacterized protein n=1 Tax=Boeremia exigua TaxID=749465 RepID=A0ACC2I837_9PLEO|nr:hypothetical protein OPT61_g6043 [Boeremia exigua]